jgi:putative membrane protein
MMVEGPFSKSSEDLLFREILAAERTVLSNERTLLAYARTALTLFVAGASFLQFFEHQSMIWVGRFFIPFGLATFAVGIWRYLKMKKRLKRLSKHRFDTSDMQP